MLCTLGSFLKQKNGLLQMYAREASGATQAFVVIFSLLACLMSCCGAFATARRSTPGIFTGCYGTCLFFFGFIPLVAVADGLLYLGSISQADLVEMCYSNIHDAELLREIALPTGATDVE